MEHVTSTIATTCDACGETSSRRASGVYWRRRVRRSRRNPWQLGSLFSVDLCSSCKLSFSKALAAWRRSRKSKA
jgi:hypothetical protein